MAVNPYDRPNNFTYRPFNYAPLLQAATQTQQSLDKAALQAQTMGLNFDHLSWDQDSEEAEKIRSEFEEKKNLLVEDIYKNKDWRRAARDAVALKAEFERRKNTPGEDIHTLESRKNQFSSDYESLRETYLEDGKDPLYDIRKAVWLNEASSTPLRDEQGNYISSLPSYTTGRATDVPKKIMEYQKAIHENGMSLGDGRWVAADENGYYEVSETGKRRYLDVEEARGILIRLMNNDPEVLAYGREMVSLGLAENMEDFEEKYVNPSVEAGAHAAAFEDVTKDREYRKTLEYAKAKASAEKADTPPLTLYSGEVGAMSVSPSLLDAGYNPDLPKDKNNSYSSENLSRVSTNYLSTAYNTYTEILEIDKKINAFKRQAGIIEDIQNESVEGKYAQGALFETFKDAGATPEQLAEIEDLLGQKERLKVSLSNMYKDIPYNDSSTDELSVLMEQSFREAYNGNGDYEERLNYNLGSSESFRFSDPAGGRMGRLWHIKKSIGRRLIDRGTRIVPLQGIPLDVNEFTSNNDKATINSLKNSIIETTGTNFQIYTANGEAITPGELSAEGGTSFKDLIGEAGVVEEDQIVPNVIVQNGRIGYAVRVRAAEYSLEETKQGTEVYKKTGSGSTKTYLLFPQNQKEHISNTINLLENANLDKDSEAYNLLYELKAPDMAGILEQLDTRPGDIAEGYITVPTIGGKIKNTLIRVEPLSRGNYSLEVDGAKTTFTNLDRVRNEIIRLKGLDN